MEHKYKWNITNKPLVAAIQIKRPQHLNHFYVLIVQIIGGCLLIPFLGTCPGRQDKTAVFCLHDEVLIRMVADEGDIERD